MEQITVKDLPSVPGSVRGKEVLANYLAQSLGLVPSKGKGDVAIALLLIFDEAAHIGEGSIIRGNTRVEVKNGALKVDSILALLQAEGKNIGKSQFYTTYLSRFLRAGIIVKKPHSMYGLKGNSLAETLRDLFRELKTTWEKIVEHAERLDREVRVSVRGGK